MIYNDRIVKSKKKTVEETTFHVNGRFIAEIQFQNKFSPRYFRTFLLLEIHKGECQYIGYNNHFSKIPKRPMKEKTKPNKRFKKKRTSTRNFIWKFR